MPERQKPSHVLRVDVPLNFDANPAAENYDIQGAMAEAVQVVMRLARLGTLGLMVDDSVVSVLPIAEVAEWTLRDFPSNLAEQEPR